MENKHYIKLIASGTIDKDLLRAYYDIILDKAAATIKLNDANKPITYTIEDSKHIYCICLHRDLEETEIEELVSSLKDIELPAMPIQLKISRPAVSTVKPKRLPGVFSTAKPAKVKEKATNIDWATISNEFAKHNHDLWMQSKLSHGWRWSTTFDLDNKMHPLLVSWELLPEEYRQVDSTMEVFLSDLLSSLDYVIVVKD